MIVWRRHGWPGAGEKKAASVSLQRVSTGLRSGEAGTGRHWNHEKEGDRLGGGGGMKSW